MNKILIICGPTAIGKTSLAVSLAKKYGGELVSADSRQVYQGLDIGTGKEKVDVPIHLVDIVSPRDYFSVYNWLTKAGKVISKLWKKGRLPIVVGGTGFYLRALKEGLETLSIEPDWNLRRELEQISVGQLQKQVSMLAPKEFRKLNRSDRNNPRRLIRKIEIALSGKGLGDRAGVSGDYLQIGLTAPMKTIYKRIDQRVDQRLKLGLLTEIKVLLAKGLSWDDPGMNCLAYKEFQDYFKKKMGLERAIERWRFDEHGYARRQMTWFRKSKGIVWFDISLKNWQSKVDELIGKWYISN